MEDCKIGSSGNCHLFGCARREAGKSYRAKVVENKSLDSDVTLLYKCNATRSPMCIWWLTMIPAIFSSYDLMNYWRFYGGFPWKRNREFRAADLLFYIWHLFYTFVLSTVKKKKLTCRHIFIPWWIFPLAVTVFGDAFESTLWICKRRVCSFGSLQPYAKQMDRLTCWSLHERRDPDENENPMKLSMNAL